MTIPALFASRHRTLKRNGLDGFRDAFGDLKLFHSPAEYALEQSVRVPIIGEPITGVPVVSNHGLNWCAVCAISARDTSGCSTTVTRTLNLGNARWRYLKPAAKEAGVHIGGWHDFRHALQNKLRRGGVDPVVRAGVMGHSRVELGREVYDKASLDEKRAKLVAKDLQANVQANQGGGA